MAITLITGPANAGKAQVAIDAVRGHLARGGEPLFVVPTRADVEHYRRELAGAGVMMGVRVERFSDLIDDLVQRAGVSEPLLGAAACERLLALAAQRAFARASTPASARIVDSARAFVSELRLRRVSAARLGEAVARWNGAGAPARALVELYGSYEESLHELGCVDAERRAIAALDLLRRRPARWGGRPVVVYGFDDLDRLQLDVIETLGAVVDAPVTVSLTYQAGRSAFAGRASTHQALAPLAGAHTELPPLSAYYAQRSRAALSHLERSLFEPQPQRIAPGGAIRLLEGGGERAELELVAREVGAQLQRGVAPEEIAVVARLDGSVGDLLEDVFSQAAIPFSLERRRSFGDSATGRALLGLLRCAGPEGELEDLLAWLRAPGVLTHLELADGLEASARRAGVLSAAAARELWERRHWSLDAVDHVRRAAERGPGALIERAARELRWLFCRPRLGAAAVLADDELDEASALGAGARALAELADLARRSPALAPAQAEELARALERVRLFSGRPPSTGAVAVLDPLALRARRVRAVFLCRLQEGVFPSASGDRPLLTDDERGGLAEASGLRLGRHEDALAAERFLFYAAVSRPQELLVLSWHTADDDGSPRARSLFVDDVCDLFEQRLESDRAQRALGDVDAPAGRAPRFLAVRDAGELQGDLLDEQLLASLQTRVWSASSLETWVSCPVRWYVENILRARDLEPEPEPRARGSLAHVALRDTLEGLRREIGSARVTASTVARACELLGEALERNEPGHPLSVAPERQPGARRRLRADLERYLRETARGADEAGDVALLEPTHLELGFGFDAEHGEDALPALDLGGGLRLRGRIDRIDVGQDGRAIVYDYKGRIVSPAARWVADGVLQAALYMRAVEQLLGLRAVGGLYQPLRGDDLRPRGVLECDSAPGVDGVPTDYREPDELRDLLDEVLQLAQEAAAQAARGELRARPQTCGYGNVRCAYPTICRCEQR